MTTLGLQYLQHLENHRHNLATEEDTDLTIAQKEDQFARDLIYKYAALNQDWLKHVDDKDIAWAKVDLDKLRVMYDDTTSIAKFEADLKDWVEKTKVKREIWNDTIDSLSVFSDDSGLALSSAIPKLKALLTHAKEVDSVLYDDLKSMLTTEWDAWVKNWKDIVVTQGLSDRLSSIYENLRDFSQQFGLKLLPTIGSILNSIPNFKGGSSKDNAHKPKNKIGFDTSTK